MVYRTALEAPMRYQWDADSRLPAPDPGSAPNNCGPTSVEMIAQFYTDRWNGIYHTRRLGTWDDYRGTSVNEQQAMLERRGVPCYFAQLTLSQVRLFGSTGTWPILLGMDFSKVPDAIAGHPFRGWHAVVRAANRVDAGIIRDPNFNRTYRKDPTRGHRKYPDWVIQQAFVDAGGWALIPRLPKRIPAQLPDTSITVPIRADGDQGMRFRSMRDGSKLPDRTLLAGKPIRKGITIASGRWALNDERRTIHPIGRWPKEDLPKAEQKYGDVFVIDYYIGDGSVFGYVKQVDLAGN